MQAEQELTRQREEEKAKRVEALQKHAARRIQQLELSRGWAAWAGQFRERQRTTRVLGAGLARMLRPLLAASLVHWRQDWAVAVRDAQQVTGATDGGRLPRPFMGRGSMRRRHYRMPSASSINLSINDEQTGLLAHDGQLK